MHLCNMQWSVQQHLVDIAPFWRQALFIIMLCIAVAQCMRCPEVLSILKGNPTKPKAASVTTFAQMSPVAVHGKRNHCMLVQTSSYPIMMACTLDTAFDRVYTALCSQDTHP